MPSDVQVFVRFRDQCVFAGEELHCTITFKNVAEHIEPQIPTVRHTKRNSVQQLAVAQVNNARHEVVITRPPSNGQNGLKSTHRSASSVSSAPSSTLTSPVVGEGQFGKQHQRSVSIISGTSPILPQIQEKNGRSGTRPGHRRSSTITAPTRSSSSAQINIDGDDLSRRISQPERQLSADFRPSRAGRRSPLSASHSHSPSDADRDSVSDFKFPI